MNNSQQIELLIDVVYKINQKNGTTCSKKDILEALIYIAKEDKKLITEAGMTSKLVDFIFKALEKGRLRGLIKKAQRKDPELARQLQSLQVASDYIVNYINNDYKKSADKGDALDMLAAINFIKKKTAK